MNDRDNTFLGRGWKFPPTFIKDRAHVEMVEAEQDIDEAIHLILLTTKGERIMQPEFGSDVKRFVFREITASTISRLESSIKKSILLGEPRVICDKITSYVDEANGLIQFSIDYIVRTTNNRRNIVFPFYIEEGTNVKLIQG